MNQDVGLTMERRLREWEPWFSTILRAIGDAVVATDREGNVTFLNPAAEALTGVTLEQAIGCAIEQVVSLVDDHGRQERESPLREALRAKRKVLVREGGIVSSATRDVRAITHGAWPVVDGDELLGAVVVFHDITLQKDLRRRLEIADRLTSLGTMARGVAHEINNPLAAMTVDVAFVAQALGNHEKRARELRLSGNAVDDETEAELDGVADALQNLATAAGRIGKIVTDLRMFARPSERADAKGDVNAAVAWALRAVAFDYRTRARLVTDLATSLPAVDLSEPRLGQVLVNLLINAAHAIEPGALHTNEVRVTTRLGDSRHVVIEVQDTGCGMSLEVLGHLFEPFYTTKPAGVGAGLGLSICHDIVTSAAGQIQVESHVGQGSLFRIVLPAASAAREPSALSSNRPAKVQGGATRRGRILAIDDDAMVLGAIRRTLGSEHDLTAVQSARAALEILGSGAEIDLILSDVTMPDMTGVELYEKVVLRWPERATRIVFLTGGAITAESEAFLRSIPNVRVDKPFDTLMFRELVGSLLAKLDA